MPGPVAPVPCPLCQGQMWDNSNDPKRKGNQPHYRCKNRKKCDGAIWLTDSQVATVSAGRPAPAAPTRGAPAPARRPLVLEAVMGFAIDEAIVLSRKFKDGDVEGADHDITLRIAQSLFIARTDGNGIFGIEKAALVERAKKERERQEAARKAAEVAAEEARARAAAEDRARQDERARQTSLPQVGSDAAGTFSDPYSDFPPLGDQDDDLPF